MKNRHILSIVTVGLALGTAWAIRGRFGHEQGAAWAGAIGALCLILVARRRDWHRKAFRIAMAAAFGWGISGVMSYGVVVGYGRGTDFVNVFYGLLMLFVIGILYGFLGGGLFGLALLDSKNVRIKWHSVVVEMIALGLLTYGVLINQLGWFMTPPRSEMWAACLGAAIALAWYLKRNDFSNVMRVAVWSALGAGFGFAFGNFLQVLGNSSGVAFNFWNVMEYSIGFFGGLGMAYGTFTSEWPATDEEVRPNQNLLPIFFVALFIPFVVWDQSFVTDRFDFVLEQGGSLSTVFFFKAIAIAAVLIVAIRTLLLNYSQTATDPTREGYAHVKEFFILYTALYIFLSFLITGIWTHPVEQYLYVVNFGAILYLVSVARESFTLRREKPQAWLFATGMSVVVIALLAIIAMNSHNGMHGSQVRFGTKAASESNP